MKGFEDEKVQVFAAFVVAYLSLCYVPALDTMTKQREGLARLRTVLRKKFNLVKIQVRRAEDEDGMLDGQEAPGWRLPPLAFLLVFLVQLLANLYEGRTTYVFHMTYIAGLLALCIAFGSHHSVQAFTRFNYLHQVISLLISNRAGTLDKNLIVRAIITRTVSCVTITERLDESFLQLFGMTLILGMYRSWSDPHALLPMKMFLSFVVPTTIIGFRDWLSSSRILSKKHAPTFGALKLSPKLFGAILLPTALLLLPLFDRNSQNNLFLLVSSVDLALSIFLAVLSDSVDDMLMHETIVQMKKKQIAATELEKPVEGDDEGSIRTLASRLAMICALTSWALLLSSVSSSQWPVFLISNLCMMLTFKLKASIFEPVFAVFTTTKVIDWHLVSHLLVLFILGIIERKEGLNTWQKLAVLVVITSRLLCSFDNSTFCKLQIKGGVIFASASIVVHTSDIQLMRFVAISSAVGYVMILLLVLSKETALQLSKRENDAYAFFTHALKQKYCAVGSAAEHAIDIVQAAEQKLPVKLRSALLKDIIMETRRGHDACHAVSLMRNVRYQMYHGNAVTRRSLKAEIDFLIERGIVHANRVLVSDSMGDTLVELDLKWDVLKGFIVHFTSRMYSIHIRYENGWEYVSIEVIPKNNFLESDMAVIHAVARTLGAMSVVKGTFTLAVASTSQNPTPTGSIISTTSSSSIEANQKSLPPNMVFAVVDDTALIRLSVKRTLEAKANAHPTSIYVGQTEEECRGFPHQVLDLKPDIVLIDENLVEDIKGTDLARTIRKLGFRKCLLLHSAGSLSSDMPLDPSFDGMVEKTGSRDELVQNIGKMYRRHLTSIRESSVHGNSLVSPRGSGMDDASSVTTISPDALKQMKHYGASLTT